MTNYKKDKLDKVESTLIIISVLFLLFAFFSPYIFTHETFSGLDFTETGQIGDTFGGIMNPFIAIVGVLITFLAFYIQYKANKQQRELFRLELDNNKYENQFYEMLKLHKENVNEVTVNFTKYNSGESTIQNDQIRGRQIFEYYLEELKIIYQVAKKRYEIDDKDKLITIAYNIFFHGINYFISDPTLNEDQRNMYKLCKDLQSINDGNNGNVYRFRNLISEKSEYQTAKILNYDLFQGHSAYLAHYYRHLFQTVKFITKQDENFLSYEEKREYLRILRSQLSNQEQAMIFYNWKSDFGKNWESKNHRFFTDYRMIYNSYF